MKKRPPITRKSSKPSHKPAKEADSPPELQPPKGPPKEPFLWSAHRRLWKVVIVCGILVGLVVGIRDLWAPVWPTVPELTPGSTNEASPLLLPFTISNKSGLFDLHDVHVTCLYGAFITKRFNWAFNNRSIGLGFDRVASMGSAVYNCTLPIGLAPSDNVMNAIMWVTIRYSRPYLLSPTSTTYGPFFYDGETFPGRWIVGLPIR